jgi:glutathione S-transferase
VLELYASEPNTFFLKPLIALAEKGASFTAHYFDAANFDQFAAGFPTDLESSLQLEREGPLLVHDGTYSESYLRTVDDRLAVPLARVENALTRDAWLAGPNFSAADIDAYPMLCVLPDLAPAAVNAKSTPRIVEYVARIAGRASVRTALRSAKTPHPERHFVPGIEASRWG